MDLEKQKRNRLIKVLITEVFMVMAIIPIVMLLTLLAMGYHLNDDLSLERSGLVQVDSLPSGADVKVDGEIKWTTDSSRMLTGGTHKIEITKKGFDSWSKEIEVVPGLLLRLRYPRLFKKTRQAEKVLSLSDVKMTSVSPNRAQILYQSGMSPKFQAINIKGNEVKTSEVDLTGVLYLNEAGEFAGTINQVKWSWGGDAAILQINYGDNTEWVLTDMRNNVPNRNLTKDFGLEISDAQFAGNSTDRIYILENGNLRELNVGSDDISKVLLGGVSEFYAGQEYIGYVGATDDSRVIGLYRNGDDAGVIAAEIADDVPAHVAISEYYGEKYLIYTLGEKLVIYSGDNFPSAGGSMTKMQKIIDTEIGVIAAGPLTVSRTGEVVLIQNQQTLVAVDLETNKPVKYEMPVATARFIDDYLLYGVVDGELSVWDFDGGNKRALVQGALDFTATISANNHWLYYMTLIDEQPVLMRERID